MPISTGNGMSRLIRNNCAAQGCPASGLAVGLLISPGDWEGCLLVGRSAGLLLWTFVPSVEFMATIFHSWSLFDQPDLRLACAGTLKQGRGQPAIAGPEIGAKRDET